MSGAEISAAVACVCDACGQIAFCRRDEGAPPGWFFHPVRIEDAETSVACSEACKAALAWVQQPARPAAAEATGT